MQADLKQYYDVLYPGRVQVLGADMYNGTEAQLRSFRTQTGATYPLLLQGASGVGGNLNTLYGPFDNYLVINADGIVRYHSANIHPHGDRYYLNEIRNAIHQRFDPQEKTLIQSYDDAGNNQVFVDMARLQTLGLSLTNMAAFLEQQPPFAAVFTEDEVRAAQARLNRAVR